jgi:hypothetical protein
MKVLLVEGIYEKWLSINHSDYRDKTKNGYFLDKQEHKNRIREGL